MTSPIRAVLVSGHLVDADDRPAARFPRRAVEPVRARIGAAFDGWQVGPGFVVVCGGARGADILGAEEGIARGARVVVCLSMPPDDFEENSVDLDGSDWAERFRRLLAVAEVQEVPGGSAGNPEAFATANAWMVKVAHDIDPQPYALFVWDGLVGDGPGGTKDMVDRTGYEIGDPRLVIIDPTVL